MDCLVRQAHNRQQGSTRKGIAVGVIQFPQHKKESQLESLATRYAQGELVSMYIVTTDFYGNVETHEIVNPGVAIPIPLCAT